MYIYTHTHTHTLTHPHLKFGISLNLIHRRNASHAGKGAFRQALESWNPVVCVFVWVLICVPKVVPACVRCAHMYNEYVCVRVCMCMFLCFYAYRPQHTATHTATHCNTHCNTLQHTLQHTATDCPMPVYDIHMYNTYVSACVCQCVCVSLCVCMYVYMYIYACI